MGGTWHCRMVSGDQVAPGSRVLDGVESLDLNTTIRIQIQDVTKITTSEQHHTTRITSHRRTRRDIPGMHKLAFFYLTMHDIDMELCRVMIDFAHVVQGV